MSAEDGYVLASFASRTRGAQNKHTTVPVSWRWDLMGWFGTALFDKV